MNKQATPVNMKKVFSVLNKMKEDGVFEKYAVGGAVACSIHLEPAYTADMDIFVMLNRYPGKKVLSLQQINDYLLSRGAKLEGQYIVYAGWPLQFLPADISPLVAEALDRAEEYDADGLSIWIFSSEHLAAIALEVGRGKDKLRLNTLIESGILDMRKFKAILRRHGLEKKYEDWLKWQKAL